MSQSQLPLQIVPINLVAERLQALVTRAGEVANTISLEACEVHDDAALVTAGLSPQLGFEVLAMAKSGPDAVMAAEEAVAHLLKLPPNAWRFDATMLIAGTNYLLRPTIVPPMPTCGHIAAIMDGLGMRIGAFVEMVRIGESVELSHHVQCSHAPVQDALTFAEFVADLGGAVAQMLGEASNDDEDDVTLPLEIDSLLPLYPQPTFTIDEFGDVQVTACYVDLEDTMDGVEGDIRTHLALSFTVEGTVIAQIGAFLIAPEMPFQVPDRLLVDRAWLSTLVDSRGTPWPEVAKTWANGDYGPQSILRIDRLFMAPAFQDVALLRHMVHTALWVAESWSNQMYGMTIEANDASNDLDAVEMTPSKRAWYEAAFKNELGAIRARSYGYVSPLDKSPRPPVFVVPGPPRMLATPLD